MVDMSSKSTSLKDYLKKYTSNDDAEKKKKKKIKKGKPVSEGVLIVDEDPTWQRPVKLNEEEDSTDEDKPQVDEDIEVKHMKRLEQLRSRRPFGAISEDGSGWVSVSQNSKNLETENQNSDIYPPPKRRPRNDTPSPKPNREPVSVSDVDLSPPRQPRKHLHSASSPPRRAPRGSGYRVDSHASSAIDLSPPRKVDNGKTDFMHVSTSKPIFKTGDDVNLASSVRDLSPPRKRRKESPLLIDRAKTGLVSGVDIKEEIDRKKKEDLLRFKEMDPSVSGRNAEAVYRNKSTGERMSKEEFLKSQKDKMKKEEKPKEIKLEWGKGLAQKREAEAKLEEFKSEMDKPFARSRDDADLDRMLKERVRWGDPMAHLVTRKHSLPVLPDLGDSEKMKESGFIIPQEIPSHSWIKRRLEAAPNRYGIKPGRHWDGVDRSNGYEKEMFKRTNEKRATETEAYMWSVSEM